jgi:tetratricopeptide (TPR) repeat protein
MQQQTLHRRFFAIFLIIIGMFVTNYVIGWLQSLRLANTYYLDAEDAYASGDYLNALTGYKEFDPEKEKYVQRGGYLQVERIWVHSLAWPRPAVYDYARLRIQEIIQERITISMAEGFIQANIGKSTPYLGIIYLRLGELYEQEGDLIAAKDVYQLIRESFPSQPDLIAQAQAHLDSLAEP